MPDPRRVQVFGPAYLDRVLLVDGPIHESGQPPVDQSVDGVLTFGHGLRFSTSAGFSVTIEPPDDWPGPTVLIDLSGVTIRADVARRGLAWHDDLGGMGAGFAAALGGELIHAVGSVDDPMSREILDRLDRLSIRRRTIRVPQNQADWTLLVTSGPFGDKMPVGFRGCHAAVGSLKPALREAGDCDLRVVASWPNRLAAEALNAPGAGVRVFAPTLRNMRDREYSVVRFAESIDILCCNLREWEALDDREQIAWRIPVLAVTNGPSGSSVRFTTPEGEPGRVDLAAFPRLKPPRDTNRAGEAFAATLITSLLDAGWSNGVVDQALMTRAAERARAAAGLVLDRLGFGFPTTAEIDTAIRAGRVE